MTRVPKNSSGGNSRAKKEKKPKQLVKPHCKSSIEDINWVRVQDSCVQQLWLDCVAAEQFGGSAHKLDTSLDIKGKSFKKAKQLIAERGLFTFIPIQELMPSGQSKVVGWKIINCHGYYNKAYWGEGEVKATEALGISEGGLGKAIPTLEECDEGALGIPQGGLGKMTPTLQPETLDIQKFQETQPSINYRLTTPQQPTKVVEGGVGESVEDSFVQPPPLAAPLEGVGVSATFAEEEELPHRPAYSEWELREALEQCAKTNEFPGQELLNQCLQIDCLRIQVPHLIRCHPEWGVLIEGGCVVRARQIA